MTPQLTINEKFAIVSILSKIMKADGIIHPKEEEYLDGIYKAFGITINDLENIANIDDIHAKHCIEGMSRENKDYVRTLFVHMAECDGYVHPKEMEIINNLFGHINNYNLYIIPIYRKIVCAEARKTIFDNTKLHVKLDIRGNGFFAGQFFITAAHVIEDNEGKHAFIKIGNEEKKLSKENALIWRSMSQKPMEEEYRNPHNGDVAVYKIGSINSPLVLSEIPPVFGDSLSCYHKDSGSFVFGKTGDIYWDICSSGNFFDWKPNVNNVNFKEGDSGSPLVKNNKVFGILHGGARSICLFTTASFVKKLLQAQSL